MKTSTLAGLVVASLGALASSASCTSFSGEGEPQADAGAGDATAASDAVSSDAVSSDAVSSDSGACPVLFDKRFTDAEGWMLGGDAKPGGDSVILTSSNINLAGVAVWKTNVLPGRYEVEVELDLSAPGGPNGLSADGMAVWWSEDAGLTPSFGGRSFAVCSSTRKGLAVVVDTYLSSLRIVNLEGCVDWSSNSTGELRGPYTLRVSTGPKGVEASLEKGGFAFARVSAPMVTAFATGFTGLSASTGSNYMTHAVKRAKMTSCSN